MMRNIQQFNHCLDLSSIFHKSSHSGDMKKLHLYPYRSDYRTPLPGLYLCGSGTHPGGGVMGAPGRNAAHVVLQDMKKLTAP